MTSMTEEDLLAAHRVGATRNRDSIGRSRQAGCFYCLRVYPAKEVVEWVAERDGSGTAICPRCGIDSVVGDGSGFPVTDDFLKAMHTRWFET
jgi:hypothetical protein